MAELTGTQRGRRVPHGTEFEIEVVVTPSGIAATNDFVDCSNFGIHFVNSAAGQTEGPADQGVNVLLRNEGTDSAEPDNDAAVGVESTGTQDVLLRVRGRP